MEQFNKPIFDDSVRTVFLRLSIARAMTPRARARIHALRELERLLAIAADRQQLGVRGFLLNSLGKDFPVSKRAMELELLGRGPQGLVEVAEQIELKLWVAPCARSRG